MNGGLFIEGIGYILDFFWIIKLDYRGFEELIRLVVF